MIEPTPLPPEEPSSPKQAAPRQDPVVVEDLAAVLRIPSAYRKVDRVLESMRSSFELPDDHPFRPWGDGPGDKVREYGLAWRDADELLQLFAGMSWGDSGHDPLWEVRVEALEALDPNSLREGKLHRLAARRAESRFREWDRFWHEDQTEARFLIGASAACTRFLEETDPDATAAEYLAGALHALHVSGALHALLQAAREVTGRA